MKTITKKKLKLSKENILKIGDFCERQFLPETVQDIRQHCKMYHDMHDLGENIYSIGTLVDSTDFDECTEEVKTELLELQKVLDKHDCAYMRFIY